MKYAQEGFRQAYSDAQELVSRHHKEVMIFDGLELDIDAERYSYAEEIGTLKVFTARKGGELVGYASFFLYTHTHHKTSIHATQDTLFVAPEHRGVGIEFSQFCDDQLRHSGVSFIHRGLPIDSPFGKKLVENGYEPKETVYIRRLL